MPLPVVAIIGRPNVGKSSLYNMLVGRRAAIVEPTAGVTRDRITSICEIDETYFELVDTGGIGIVDHDDLSEHVERQIHYAINQADLILFLVDGREGLNPLDQRTAELLRRENKHVQLIANKVDEPHFEHELGEFNRLGFSDPMAISALNGNGRRALRELIVREVGTAAGEIPPDPVLKVALVGKRNAGKSTFVNALAGEDRVIVSEIPGTTRDSIDVRFEKDDRIIVAVDTAGIRKKSKMANDIEFYAYMRATSAIQRCDVVLFLIDATVPVGQIDKQLAGLIAEEHKPCVIVINKWDLAKERADTDEYGEYLSKTMPGLSYAPVAFTSASQGRNVDSVIDLATELWKQSQIRVGTGMLNQVLRAALDGGTPFAKRGKKAPKFFYATQVSTQPPTIVVFVNNPRLVVQSYERYLLNRLREALPFAEIPIRLVLRRRRGNSREP